MGGEKLNPSKNQTKKKKQGEKETWLNDRVDERIGCGGRGWGGGGGEGGVTGYRTHVVTEGKRLKAFSKEKKRKYYK